MTDTVIPPVESIVRISIAASNAHYGALVDRCAVDASGTLYLLSCVAPGAIIKGISGHLARGASSPMMTIESTTFLGPLKTEFNYSLHKRVKAPEQREFMHLFKYGGGYSRSLQRLEYGNVHAVFLANQPGLLLNLSPRAIEQALRNPIVCTTPFLSEWVPYIAGRLRESKVLNDLYGFQCRAAILRPGSTKTIDEIVLEGGRAGILQIPA
jgi:hypothetical protein